jgi:hypothetical protein
MKTLPKGHNPENKTLDPGYRFLSADEPRNLTDEVWGECSNKWVTLKYLSNCGHPLTGRPHWTVRRPLCHDDQYAPPPSEWTIAGWTILSMSVLTGATVNCLADDEYWDRDLKWTRQGLTTGRPYSSSNLYIRRKVPQTVSQGLKVNQSIVVATHGIYALSHAVQTLAIAAGRCTKNEPIIRTSATDMICINPSSGRSSDIQFASERYWREKQRDAIYLDARTDMGKLIDLLQTKMPVVPVGPTVNGHVGQYTKGRECILFGCAVISVELIRALHETINPANHVKWGGNRTVDSITLSSGVKLTKVDTTAILAYVDAVNKVT